MPSVEIYDPALCCSTGVCGPSVDPALTQFAADLAWLDTAGVEVARYNLASEPGKFIERAEVKDVLTAQGEQGLPAVVVDGDLRCTGRYPSRDELSTWTGAAGALPDGSVSLLPVAGDQGGCCAPGEC